VLLAHPSVLEDLIKEYEALPAMDAHSAKNVHARQRLADVAYTLCVSTGTRDVEAALVAARQRASGVR
jgi:hypothetical protein